VQDKFVADVGDYGKYGLLRALCGLTGSEASDQLSLGIVWYFVRDRGIGYLDDPDSFRDSDPEVFDALLRIVNDSQRSVASIALSRVFPARTVFFPEAVPTQLGDRKEWLQRALESTKDCELVFLDPDNGLTSGSLGDGSISSKHVYYEELKRFLGQVVPTGQSVVIYHHLPRKRAEDHIQTLRTEMARALKLPEEPWALLYRRFTLRAYFIIPHRHHRNALRERINRFLDGPWGQNRREGPHFQRVS